MSQASAMRSEPITAHYVKAASACAVGFFAAYVAMAVQLIDSAMMALVCWLCVQWQCAAL